MKIRVLHKGLFFIISASLLISLFFFHLYQLVDKAERLADSEARFSRAVATTQGLLLEFASGWATIGSQLFGKSKVIPIMPEKFLRRTNKFFAESESLIREYPQFKGTVDHLKEIEQDELSVLNELKSADRESPAYGLRQLMHFAPKMNALALQMAPILQDLDKERETLEKARAEELQARNEIRSQVTFGISIAFLFMLFATIVFLSDITRRLAALVEHARLIPTNQPLQHRVSGTDELAYLDTVLHDVSIKLANAAQHRKSLMEMVAHDLRSPLMSSKLSLQLLLEHSNDRAPEDVTRISNVKDNLSHMYALVEDLLVIEQLEEGKLLIDKDWVDIKDLVDECNSAMHSLSAAKEISLINETESVLLDIDKLRISQVLHNLLTNAVKFSPKNSDVVVRSEHLEKLIKLSVIDKGIGLDAEAKKKVFDKFYQSNSVPPSDLTQDKGGFGLGLAISKLIVAAHGGSIGVESTPGEGSTFWFTLPFEDVDDPEQ